MNRYIEINKIRIGAGHKPYIIAEMSANHGGDIENAKKIIKEAKIAGANAVKLQTYTADTLTLNSKAPDFMIEEGLWAGQTLYDLYEQAHTPWEWHKELFELADDLGITAISTPFDKTAVDFLEDLNVPAYKIASFEITDHELVAYAASTKKPMIISTGMANLVEIEEAVEQVIASGCMELALLHCVSGYPAPPSDYNLVTIRDLSEKFKVPIGLSDHTLGNSVAIASISMGASLIEKHFTLDRNGGGPDDSFSMEPSDLKDLCTSCAEVFDAIGVVNYDRKQSEQANLKFRRSLYFIRDMQKGDTITESCVRSIRPGYGISPKHLKTVLGKRVATNVEAGTPVTLDALENEILS